MQVAKKNAYSVAEWAYLDARQDTRAEIAAQPFRDAVAKAGDDKAAIKALRLDYFAGSICGRLEEKHSVVVSLEFGREVVDNPALRDDSKKNVAHAEAYKYANNRWGYHVMDRGGAKSARNANPFDAAIKAQDRDAAKLNKRELRKWLQHAIEIAAARGVAV